MWGTGYGNLGKYDDKGEPTRTAAGDEYCFHTRQDLSAKHLIISVLVVTLLSLDSMTFACS